MDAGRVDAVGGKKYEEIEIGALYFVLCTLQLSEYSNRHEHQYKVLSTKHQDQSFTHEFSR